MEIEKNLGNNKGIQIEQRENYGVTYERFSLGKFIRKLVPRYNIKSVLDIASGGLKGISGMNSVDFARAGCRVYVLNATREAKGMWESLGLREKVNFVDCKALEDLPFEKNKFDLVWDLKNFPKISEPKKVLEEMTRVSRKSVLVFVYNGLNFVFPIHRLVHKTKRVPWTHGAVEYMRPSKISNLFNDCKLQVQETGIIDAPPWPGPIGFKDMRFHKIETMTVNWQSPYLNCFKEDRYPFWLKGAYAFERLPLPLFLKLLHAHVFYVIGKK